MYDEISRVGKNTPAEKAGLRVGDKFATPMQIRNVYPIGTTITLSIIRDGIIRYINVTVDKICTN